jgi:hypothetical protein
MKRCVLLITAVAIAVSVTGCEDEQVDADPCPVEQPVLLDVAPETDEEAAVVHNLVACTDDAQTTTYLYNDDESTVWIIDRPQTPWGAANADLMIELFRITMAEFGVAGLTLEPDQGAIVNASPAEVHLRLDANVQSAWQTMTLVVDELADKAQDRVKELLSKPSRSHKAVVDCLFAGYAAGGQVAQAGESQAPEDVIEASLGVVSGIGQCATSIREAEPERIVTLDTVAGKTRAKPWRVATSRSMNSFAKLGVQALRATPWA